MTNSDISKALQVLSPGAEWSLSGDDLTGLVWLDKVQARPLDVDIKLTVSTNALAQANRNALKLQARQDVKSAILTPIQRLQALLVILDLDQ